MDASSASRPPDGADSTFSAALTLEDIYQEKCRALRVRHPNTAVSMFLRQHPDPALLESVDVSRDYLGARGVMALIETIARCPGLQSLNLSNQRLFVTDDRPTSVPGNQVLHFLCQKLGGHTTLTRLDLENNDIGTVGYRTLVSLVRCTPNLRELHLSGNFLSEQQLQHLSFLLDRASTLRSSPAVPTAPRRKDAPVAPAAAPRQPKDLERLRSAAGKNHQLSMLPTDSLNSILPHFSRCQFLRREQLIDLGDEPAWVYLIGTHTSNLDDGTAAIVEVSFPDGSTVRLPTGCLVGEFEVMLAKTKRETSARVLVDLEAWALSVDVYKTLVLPTVMRCTPWRNFLELVPSLQSLSLFLRHKLCDCFTQSTCAMFHEVFQEHEALSDVIVIVMESRLTLRRRFELRQLTRGDLLAVSNDSSATVSADMPRLVLAALDQPCLLLHLHMRQCDCNRMPLELAEYLAALRRVY